MKDLDMVVSLTRALHTAARRATFLCQLCLLSALLLSLPVAAFDQGWRPPQRQYGYVPVSDVACPSQDFSIFIQKFADDETVQRVFTRIPLISFYSDVTNEPDDKPTTKTLGKEQIKFPVLPLAQERKTRSLIITVTEITPTSATVSVTQYDRGFLDIYLFGINENKCWILYRIEDWST
jgi:hypothetical protein